MREPILVTGAAGFIGFHLARRLLADGWTVHGVDNLNDYYDPRLKQARLDELQQGSNFHFEKCDLADRGAVAACSPSSASLMSCILRLRPVSRIRRSIPTAYVDANLVGFANILEGCRHAQCRHLVYASSSSVYGANQRMPLRVSDRVDEPLSLYGATKRANELMAYAYAHLFGLPATGLRFFTVYGPWGRPDMAVWLFTQAIFEDRPVRLFNHGHMRRDFTYVDDVIEAVVRLIEAPPAATAAAAAQHHRSRRTASTMSATRSRSRSPPCSIFWKRSSASRPGANCCRCVRSTCSKPLPTVRSCSAPRGLRRARRSKTACARS